MDHLDDLLKRLYKKNKDRLISPAQICPQEALLLKYLRGELKEDERERLDEHFLACSACLETLKVIRMIQQAQSCSEAVPGHLHQRAKEILSRELAKSGGQAKSEPFIMKIALLWDQARQRIIQAGTVLEEALIAPNLVPNPVRKAQPKTQEGQYAFPYRIARETDLGSISLEIDRSDREGYLLLRLSFQPKPGNIPRKADNLRVVLSKAGKVSSSVYLDPKGQAIFHRIREAEYSLELLAGEDTLGVIEFSLKRG